ncbi:uncharacterized protein [Battus philenor]|uniref:uncharacterized protein n=1 Tax=Battus philenor TaxID=42288 RepID=UPI0035CFAD30
MESKKLRTLLSFCFLFAAGSTCFAQVPTQAKEKVSLQTSYDKFPDDFNFNPEEPINRACAETSTLVQEIENSEVVKLPSLEKYDHTNEVPCLDESNSKNILEAPRKPLTPPLKIEKETQKGKDAKPATDFTLAKDSRMINKRVTASLNKQSTYNISQQAIFVPNVDACISMEHLMRDRSHSCQKRKCCQTKSKFSPLRRRSKHVSDQTQIFPEKLSCGIDRVDPEPNTWEDSCQKQAECETLPKGCVPYRTLTDNCDQSNCLPSPCASQTKDSCPDSEAIPEKLSKHCDKRVTVNSKIKTIEPPSSPQQRTRRCDDEPIQTSTPKFKTRVIDAKPKHTQDCGCSTTSPPSPSPLLPPPPCDDYEAKEKHKRMDKISSAHRYKKPSIEPKCSRQRSAIKPAERLPSGIKPRPSCSIIPPQDEDSCMRTEKKYRPDTNKCRRRLGQDERGSILKSSVSDTLSSRAKLRTSSLDSIRSRRRSRSFDNFAKNRRKSAPIDSPQFEEDEPSSKPPEDNLVCKRLPADYYRKPARKKRCERNDQRDSYKPSIRRKADTRDVGVEIRCPICTCATQCHGTSCYRSVEVNTKSQKSCNDVMSPSRYIMESQRQYNEVISSKITKCLCPALVHHHKYGGYCASKIKQNSLRGHKKRKPEHYAKKQRSPRVSDDRTRSDDSTKPAIRLLRGLRRYRTRNRNKIYVNNTSLRKTN